MKLVENPIPQSLQAANETHSQKRAPNKSKTRLWSQLSAVNQKFNCWGLSFIILFDSPQIGGKSSPQRDRFFFHTMLANGVHLCSRFSQNCITVAVECECNGR